MSWINNIKVMRATTLYSKDKHTQANALFDQAYAGGITSARSRLLCANNYLRRGYFQKAYDLVQPLLKHKDARISSAAKSTQGIALWKLGQTPQSVQLLREVFHAGKNGVIYGTLGCVLIDYDLDEAERFNLEAYDYDEDDAVVLDNLGQIYYRKGELEKARDYLKRALHRRPTQADSLYLMALIEHQQGNLENARKLLEISLKKPISCVCMVTQQKAEEALEKVCKQLDS